MSMPLIYAKAAFNKEQMDAKLAAGTDGIELQLLDEMLTRTEDGRRKWRLASAAYDIDNLITYPVSAVHAPLLSGMGDITLENMLDSEDVIVLNEMFRIADAYAKQQDKVITLIVHLESYVSSMLDVGGVYYRMLTTLDSLLSNYPNVRVGIENVTPCITIGLNTNLHLSNNFGFDNIELVTKLRADLKTDRVGTILDTCHAMISFKYVQAICDVLGNDLAKEYTIDKFFEKNREFCYHIHFAGMQGSGYGGINHGTPFTDQNKSMANGLLKLYEKFNYVCPLCLEVFEPDGHIKSIGYKSTKEVVEKYFNNPK